MADLKITELDANTTPIGTDVVPIVDDPAGTPKTEKITLANLGIIDGWMPASESWAYASASTITVPAGAESKYKKGDKIKLTQTTVKYWHIASVADTVLTIIVNTDYTLVDAAISANYYSHLDNPIGFPTFLTYTTTITGFVEATDTSRYQIVGGTCILQAAIYGQSDAAALDFTGPIISASRGGSYWFQAITVLDNGTWQTGMGAVGVNDATATIKVGKTIPTFVANAFGGFTASSGKGCQGVIIYPI